MSTKSFTTHEILEAHKRVEERESAYNGERRSTWTPKAVADRAVLDVLEELVGEKDGPHA